MKEGFKILTYDPKIRWDAIIVMLDRAIRNNTPTHPAHELLDDGDNEAYEAEE